MNNIFKNFSLLSGLMILLTGVLSSCETTEPSDFLTNVSVEMTSFKVNGVEGVIDNQASTIAVQLPYGSSVVALQPTITLPEGAVVTPAVGSTVNFTSPVSFRVFNGNIYKDYEVTVKAQNPILSFTINGIAGTINNTSKTISLIVPEETDLTALQPQIETAPGVSVSPASGSTLDFSEPVQFTVSSALLTEVYTATVTTPITGPSVAFLGTAATLSAITNPDELAASAWLFANYSGAKYISFADVASGTSLEDIDVIWWHHDAAASLPAAALSTAVTGKLKTYLANNGNILLTTFASQYVEALGIVPAQKGPNNVFGDFPPGGFVDGNDWGMSFVGHENHPIFENLETYASGKANLLQRGTFRLNHTAWWFLPEWGGYVNGAGWRSQTGGINLASEAWDDSLDGRVTIAEFPGSGSNRNCVVISMGAYDWHNETSNGNPSAPNGFINNIKTLTGNSLNYLVTY